MERELFDRVKRALDEVPGACRRPPNCQYTDRDVVLVLLWAVLHDRPIGWACRRENWPRHDRTRPLPSGSTMSRRLRTDAVWDLVLTVLEAMSRVDADDPVLIMDAKALPIAWHSADPDAGVGRGVGALAKGYKLHVIADRAGNLVSFAVLPLNVSEQAAAEWMLELVPQDRGGFVLADRNYDANRLYDAAGERGVQLLAERRYANARSIGHHRHSPHRLRALRLLKERRDLREHRRRIEGCFGTLGNIVGGLSPLPNWVRRLKRVERWVTVKLIIDAAHRQRRRELAA